MQQYGTDLAGMAMARGNLESTAGVLSFVVGPPLAAVNADLIVYPSVPNCYTICRPVSDKNIPCGFSSATPSVGAL